MKKLASFPIRPNGEICKDKFIQRSRKLMMDCLPAVLRQVQIVGNNVANLHCSKSIQSVSLGDSTLNQNR